jgi:hypothetical protein
MLFGRTWCARKSWHRNVYLWSASMLCKTHFKNILSLLSIISKHSYTKTQKVTTPFTAMSTPIDGLTYGTGDTASLGFIAADKGCLPAFSPEASTGVTADGKDQGLIQQLLLGSLGTSTYAGLNNDYFAVLFNLCNVYGQCCFGDLCNGANRLISKGIHNSFAALIFVLGFFLLI